MVESVSSRRSLASPLRSRCGPWVAGSPMMARPARSRASFRSSQAGQDGSSSGGTSRRRARRMMVS